MWKNIVQHDKPHKNMAHARCMLGTYKNNFRICNAYCFSSATNVARTRLNITSYVQTLLVF